MLRGWICNIFFGEVESSGVYEMYEYPPVIKAVGGGAVHDLKSMKESWYGRFFRFGEQIERRATTTHHRKQNREERLVDERA